MPRGRRRASRDVTALERELEELKARQAELRQQIRRLRNSGTEIRKLEQRLQNQFANAKWTAGLIKQLQPDYDELAVYQSVAPKKPAPRGRRPRAAATETSAG